MDALNFYKLKWKVHKVGLDVKRFKPWSQKEELIANKNHDSVNVTEIQRTDHTKEPQPSTSGSCRATMTCHHCNEIFKNYKILRKHIISSHLQQTPFYKTSKAIFKNNTNIPTMQHVTCFHCKKNFQVYKDLRKHIILNHLKTKTPLKDVQMVFKRSERVLDICHDVMTCYHCNKTFNTYSNLREHIVLNHLKQKTTFSGNKKIFFKYSKNKKCVQCSLCDFTAVHYKTLKLHCLTNCLAKHICRQPHQCLLCDFSTINSLSFKNHMLARHTNIRPNRCKLCDFSTVFASTLKEHVKVKHIDNGVKQCDLCNYKTVDPRNLRNHKKEKHHEVMPFQCSQCHYCTTGARYMKRHITVHHKGHEAKNVIQHKTTFNKQNHSNDSKRHELSCNQDLKSYRCTICATYICSTSIDLRLHMYKHKPPAVLKCTECDYHNSKSRNLKRHMKSKHADKKTHQCPLCDYGSIEVYSLRRHLLARHANDKPHQCKLCGYSTDKPANMNHHMMAKHKRPSVIVRLQSWVA